MIAFPGRSYSACSRKSLGKFVTAAAKVSFSLKYLDFALIFGNYRFVQYIGKY